MTKARTIFWTLLLVSGVVILNKLDNRAVRGHLGRAIACSDKFPFQRNSQAEILEYGLRDVRGLAWDPEKKRLFLAEGNRSLLIDWLDSGAETDGNTAALASFQETEARTMCPDESCGVVDERGLAILGGKLFSAEHGRGQVSVRELPQSRFENGNDKNEGAAWLLSATPLPGKHELLTEPSGIAAVDGTLFITDEPLRSATPANAVPPKTPAPKDKAHSAAEPTGNTERATTRPFGALYVCGTDECSPDQPISQSLHHPSGVAAEKAEGPIIVAESDTDQVRWPVYEKLDGEWRETRSLGSAPVSGEALPEFLGVALDDSRRMVFAAGPGGLFVFDVGGTLLGRIMFDEPVTGVAAGGNHVYLAVGDSLCVLTFDHFIIPNLIVAPPAQPLPNGHDPTAARLAPKLDRPKPSSETPEAKGGLGQGHTNTEPSYRAGARPCKKKSQTSRKQQNCTCSKQKSGSQFHSDLSCSSH